MTNKTTATLLFILSTMTRTEKVVSASNVIFLKNESASNLEVGTFFGSNWLAVEQETRNRLEASLSTLADECSLSSNEHVGKGIYPLSCSLSQASYCGFNPDESKSGIIDNLIFYESLGIRHLLTNYEESNNKRYGSDLDNCLSQCIETNLDSISAVSDACSNAAMDVRQNVQMINELEYTFDQYEIEFRGNILLIATLSMLASFLVIYLSSNMSLPNGAGVKTSNDEKDEESTGPCTTFCVTINWIAALAMLGFVAFSCPMFLLVILPPFAAVQFLYHCCCCCAYMAREGNQDQGSGEHSANSYILLSDSDPEGGEINTAHAGHQIYEGIPIQVV